MDPIARQAADALDSVARVLAEWTVSLHMERDETLEPRYGSAGRVLWRNEVQTRVAHLAEAIATERDALFVDNAKWSHAAFVARAISPADLRVSLECLREVLAEQLPDAVLDRATPILDAALAHVAAEGVRVPSLLDPVPGHDELDAARLFLVALLERRQDEAEAIASAAFDRRRRLADAYEGVIAPALGEIGRMWHVQEATIADEHYATAATRIIMGQLRGRAERAAPRGARLLATAVGGDLHDIGIRMVSDLFEEAGWESEFLGANMPAGEIVDAVAREDAPFDLVAVSASTSLVMRGVADLIDALRTALPDGRSIPVIVGGAPFGLVEDLWQVVGANAGATSASGALETAERLLAPTA